MLTKEGVYPRTGGGNPYTRGVVLELEGLSPHGRGKPALLLPAVAALGSIPARAGETGMHSPLWTTGKVYPRTGGGNAETGADMERRGGLSPHGRGKRLNSGGW